MNNKGLTLTELLVTIIIIIVVLGAAYLTYIKILKGFKQESEKTATQIENIVGLEMLRLDLEHIGYGIPKDENNLIIEWKDDPDKTKRSLTLRMTLNNTNQKTRGYLISQCNSSNKLNITYDGREDKSNNYVVLIKAEDRSFVDKAADISNISCESDKVYIAFPIRDEVYNGTSNACSVSYCEKITYKLSEETNKNNEDSVKRCNPNTYNLIRRVGTSNTGGKPVLNCVADWTVTFDTTDNDLSTNDKIRTNLKAINVYILVQEGKYDREYTFKPDTSDNSGSYMLTDDGQALKLPQDYQHYRWKVLKIKVKPMDL
ncbi:hypothetical protein JCM14244_01800 [Venenivibrio stagnispumantis]|uniref:Type IV pilus assembly protein PilW n=1 Tax=Venenivibrio stagnispumantis TaxID=407998 RepID=A0AA45WLA3_9AQUI|nr:prepilin-type N-terminal cleavage/methylation domain-containing protein [Venenivibrio stagnispumantis]MCW4573340.1 prepilin-type N-terminal cleavage/methylation domain-containing protein [Venenivibrio stagnispumantis]SMP10650.1 type IV pilus assembly protein PilW [Venenivibrio stagnispumantis]